MRRLGVIVAALAISGTAVAAAHLLRPSDPEPVQPIRLRPPTQTTTDTSGTPRSGSKPGSEPRRARASKQSAPSKRSARAPVTATTRLPSEPRTPTAGAGDDVRRDDDSPGTLPDDDVAEPPAGAEDVDETADGGDTGDDD